VLLHLKGVGLSLLLVAGAAGLVATSIADFTAQTTNTSTFASGTIVLSDAKTSGTTCLSTGGVNTNTNSNATGCDDLIAATVQKPGGTATTDVVTVRNVGSVTPAAYIIYTSACTPSDASGETYHGTGDICTVVAFAIHDDTNNRCYYPTQTAGACTLDATKTLTTFVASYTGAGNGLPLSLTNLSSGIAYTITTQLISTAGNNMQGRTATIDLDWKITQ
jgi:hypothetical protein